MFASMFKLLLTLYLSRAPVRAMCNPEQAIDPSARYTYTQSMANGRNGHSALLPLIPGHDNEAPHTARALDELQADVLAPVDNAGTLTPTTGHEDTLGERLRRSVMFAEVRKS